MKNLCVIQTLFVLSHMVGDRSAHQCREKCLSPAQNTVSSSSWWLMILSSYIHWWGWKAVASSCASRLPELQTQGCWLSGSEAEEPLTFPKAINKCYNFWLIAGSQPFLRRRRIGHYKVKQKDGWQYRQERRFRGSCDDIVYLATAWNWA